MTEPEAALSPEDLLRCASLATDRREWSGLVWQAFEARMALLLGQGLLRPEEARRAAWKWIEARLDQLPPPPPWRAP